MEKWLDNNVNSVTVLFDAQDISFFTPTLADFTQWINLVALQETVILPAEVSITIVDKNESQQLNHDYRGKNNPTNVLSFPMDNIENMRPVILGDLVFCAPVVEEEATQQNKNLLAHWAHLTIHGTLHLLGYDHIEEDEAVLMEQKEITLLAHLGYANPYEDIN